MNIPFYRPFELFTIISRKMISIGRQRIFVITKRRTPGRPAGILWGAASIIDDIPTARRRFSDT